MNLKLFAKMLFGLRCVHEISLFLSHFEAFIASVIPNQTFSLSNDDKLEKTSNLIEISKHLDVWEADVQM